MREIKSVFPIECINTAIIICVFSDRLSGDPGFNPGQNPVIVYTLCYVFLDSSLRWNDEIIIRNYL